jgi:hypothetical protein
MTNEVRLVQPAVSPSLPKAVVATWLLCQLLSPEPRGTVSCGNVAPNVLGATDHQSVATDGDNALAGKAMKHQEGTVGVRWGQGKLLCSFSCRFWNCTEYQLAEWLE